MSAITSEGTNPLIHDENGNTVQYGYRNMQSDNVTVTTSGTPVQLSSTALQAKRIDITADYNNTDMVVVGGSGVVGPETGRKGVPIAPGNTYTFYVTDLQQVWVDAAANGQKAQFNYFF